MRLHKFNGLLRDALTQSELADFFADRLQIPMDKAEELATRVQKKYCQNNDKQELAIPLVLFEKSDTPKGTLESDVYSIGTLSGQELARLMKWLFEELGFETHPKKHTPQLSVDFVAVKEDKRVLVQARKLPQNRRLSNSTVLVAQMQQDMQECDCERGIFIYNADYGEQAKDVAQGAGIEFWDTTILKEKIANLRRNSRRKERHVFPPYEGSLLRSLLRLAKTKDFNIESRAGGKYDLYLAGIKYPLLTFQGTSDVVTSCVFRIRFYEPVNESDGEALIRCGEDGNTIGPDDEAAYGLTVKYLEDFLE